jgi:hypothetical protein
MLAFILQSTPGCHIKSDINRAELCVQAARHDVDAARRWARVGVERFRLCRLDKTRFPVFHRSSPFC